MTYSELTPEELLSEGFGAPRITDEPWFVRWDRVGGDVEQLVLDTLPATIEFRTSGTTGASRSWFRTKELMWAESGMLASLLESRHPEAALACVPSSHLYGALTSVLVPVRLGIPAWYRPNFVGRMPEVAEHRNWVVMAIPWIFSLLRRHMSWTRSLQRVTVLHASGMIPDAAQHFLAEAGPERARIVEVIGATEAGGVATRQWSEGAPPDWQLIDDVSFADPFRPGEGEMPLHVRSERLALAAGGDRQESCRLDDYVERLDERRFRFSGRRSRLVNLNGERYNLDHLENLAQTVLDCADLAIRPVTDPMIGEHVELLVVLREGTELGALDLAAAFVRMGVRPRRVRAVDRIDRTEIGKFRRVHQAAPTGAGATS